MSELTAIDNSIISIGNSLVQVVPSVDPPTPPLDEVTIGSQTWKTKNLAIDDGQGGIYTYTADYGHGPVLEHYYTWDAAVRVAATVQGWHLPTVYEWRTLAQSVGGKAIAGTKLKSTYGWDYGAYDSGNGTDDYGFSVFPAGYLTESLDSPWTFGDYAYFWTSTPTQDWAYYEYFFTEEWTEANAGRLWLGYSVRLVKDSE